MSQAIGNYVKKTGDTMSGNLNMNADIVMNAGKTIDELDIGALPLAQIGFPGTAVATAHSYSDTEEYLDCSAICGANRALLLLSVTCTNSGNRWLSLWNPDYAYAAIETQADWGSFAVVYVTTEDIPNFIFVMTDTSGRIKVRRRDGYTQTWTIKVEAFIKV